MLSGLRTIPNKRNPFRSNASALVNFTVGVEAVNAIGVTVKLRDGNNRDGAVRRVCDVYLSDSATGDGLCATAPDSGWAFTGTGVSVLQTKTANKHATINTGVTGSFVVTLTESTAKDFYLCVLMPDGTLSIKKITFA